MLAGILVAIVIAIVLWAVSSYNRLVKMRNQALNGWRQIDVQLKRRHDLIPNLVNAVRGSMDFERDTLTAVMDARARALAAGGPADAAQKEGQLTQALGRLLAVAENYPTLKANENVQLLQEELSETETKSGSRGSSTTTSRRSSTPLSRCFLRASSRTCWGSSRRSCSKSPTPGNARFPSSISYAGARPEGRALQTTN